MSQPVNLHELNAVMLKAYQHQLQRAVDDPDRLQRVYGSHFLHADRSKQLDAICRTAAQVTASMASEINLLTEDTQITIAQYGSRLKEVPIAESYCQHQLLADNRPMRIDDSLESALLCGMSATVDAGIRAYLGVPLLTSDGRMLGTLCVYDTKPRVWREQDVLLLATLAAQVMELEEHADIE